MHDEVAAAPRGAMPMMAKRGFAPGPMMMNRAAPMAWQGLRVGFPTHC